MGLTPLMWLPRLPPGPVSLFDGQFDGHAVPSTALEIDHLGAFRASVIRGVLDDGLLDDRRWDEDILTRRGRLPTRRVVRRDVPAEFRFGAQFASPELLDVLERELGEVEGDVLGQPVLPTTAAKGQTGHQQALHGQHQQRDGLLAPAPDGEACLVDPSAIGQAGEQDGCGPVRPLGDRQVLEAGLSATPTEVRRPGLACAPGPRQDVDLPAVLGVLGLPVDPLDLEEHVDSHVSPVPWWCHQRRWRSRVELRERGRLAGFQAFQLRRVQD